MWPSLQVVNQTSVILTRERAIVINMAFVKAIITLDACYIVSPDDERSIQFMSELQRRLKVRKGTPLVPPFTVCVCVAVLWLVQSALQADPAACVCVCVCVCVCMCACTGAHGHQQGG